MFPCWNPVFLLLLRVPTCSIGSGQSSTAGKAHPGASHSARLLARGTPQVVQKLGEELVECLIEAMAENHAGLVAESADVLYHLLITWVNAGIHPEEVWAELTRREQVSHLTEGADVPLKRLTPRL